MIYLKYCTIDNDCTYTWTYLHAFQVDFWLFASIDTNPESVEKREKRLQSRREWERARRTSETAEQREERLRKKKESFILFTACSTSSIVNGTLKKASSFWKDSESKDVDCSITSSSAGFVSTCDLARFWKCWVHTSRRCDGSETRGPSYTKTCSLRFRTFLRGAEVEVCICSKNRFSRLCMHLLSSIAALNFIWCRTL